MSPLNESGSLSTPAICVNKLLLLGCFGSRARRLKRGEFLHQAALTTCCIIFMDHAFAGSFIQLTDRLQDGFFCFGCVLFECSASLVDGGTSTAACGAIDQPTLLGLSVSFDLRLNVSQGLPPKYLTFLLNDGYSLPLQERYCT